MATPYSAYARVAAREGGIDPSDAPAVQEWFLEDLRRLPPDRVEQIFEELLAADGDPRPESLPPHYPQDVPLPALADAPEAQFLGLWRRWWRAILTRVQQSKGTS